MSSLLVLTEIGGRMGQLLESNDQIFKKVSVNLSSLQVKFTPNIIQKSSLPACKSEASSIIIYIVSYLKRGRLWSKTQKLRKLHHIIWSSCILGCQPACKSEASFIIISIVSYHRWGRLWSKTQKLRKLHHIIDLVVLWVVNLSQPSWVGIKFLAEATVSMRDFSLKNLVVNWLFEDSLFLNYSSKSSNQGASLQIPPYSEVFTWIDKMTRSSVAANINL